ncbi:MAG: hypothetical protein HY645_13380 [Acidobacteria bacterium]|nr:hypothetical protein [Acidobacteriota bacterium]
MAKGQIVSALDHGTMWQLFYETDQGVATVCFDHRQFAHFYEGATGDSFYQDYRFGEGRGYVSKRLKGLAIRVEGEPFNEVVYLED